MFSLLNSNQVSQHSSSSYMCSFLWLQSDLTPSLMCQVQALAGHAQEGRRRGRGWEGWVGAWMGNAMGHWSWNRPAFLMEGWYWPGRSDVGWGLEEWVAEGGHRAGGRGVISTKSVPYDTHSHGLCLDSLFLSVWLSPHLSLSLSGLCDEGRRRWGGEGGTEMDISQPQQELCDDRGQAMSHTRDSGGPPYHAERASLNTPLLSLFFPSLSLFVSVAGQKQQTTAEDKHAHCVSKIHAVWPHW